MLLFAQVEPLSQNQLGTFAVFALVILGAAVGIKLLMKKDPIPVVVTPPPLPREDSPVTKAEMDTAIEGLKQMFETVAKRETVTVLGSRVLSVEKEIRRVDAYTHRSNHEIRNVLQYLVVGQAVIASKLGAPLAPMPKDNSGVDLDEDMPDVPES